MIWASAWTNGEKSSFEGGDRLDVLLKKREASRRRREERMRMKMEQMEGMWAMHWARAWKRRKVRSRPAKRRGC